MSETRVITAGRCGTHGAALVVAGLLIGGAGRASGADLSGVGAVVAAIGLAGLVAAGVLAIARRTKP